MAPFAGKATCASGQQSAATSQQVARRRAKALGLLTVLRLSEVVRPGGEATRVSNEGAPSIALVLFRRGRSATHASEAPWDRFDATWVDLLDLDPSDRVLLVDPGHRRNAAALRARCRQVDAVSPEELGIGGPWDVVCVDDVRLTAGQIRQLRGALAAGGLWAHVCDNAVSPLRVIDRWRGRQVGAAATRGPGELERTMRALGLEVQQVFGLLRSSTLPLTAFDVRSRAGVRTVVTMSGSHIRGGRGVALRLLAGRRSLAAWLAPACLVVGTEAARRASARPRIIGKVGNRDSAQIKIVRGDPPTEVEKQSTRPPRAAELRALRELEEVGFELAPRLLGTTPHGVRYSWLDGDPLALDDLDDDGLVAWTGRAAHVLARLHELTRRPDGSVLVHGDFWLGNLLVRGEDVTGLVDWSEARPGSPEVDRRYLVDSHERVRPADPGLRRRLTQARDLVLPGTGEPDPVTFVWGGDGFDLRGVPTRHLPDGDVERLLAEAVEQPSRPVLIPASPLAVVTMSRERDALGDAFRLLLPDPEVVEAATREPVDPTAESYLAYADADGVVVGELCVTQTDRPGILRASADPEVLGVGRTAVEQLNLRGPVTVHVTRTQSGLPAVAGVDLYLGPRHGAAVHAGVDIPGLCYADLAGLPRPHPDLRPGEVPLS